MLPGFLKDPLILEFWLSQALVQTNDGYPYVHPYVYPAQITTATIRFGITGMDTYIDRVTGRFVETFSSPAGGGSVNEEGTCERATPKF
jgi:hypothetical protein